ncbi:MAG: hypothetical protein H0W69_07240 [Gemmatimonadaceae bacterium]|nr:hypothetical protein [Gemmatimonadaceae bacterium]
MSTTRREFVERMAAGAALIGGIPLTAKMETMTTTIAPAAKDQWDLSWAKRVSAAKNRAVFDSPELESGLGVMRAGIWKAQVNEVQGVPHSQIAAVSVMRHEGIVLAMKQSFWDKYGIGAMKKATGLDGNATTVNPVLVSGGDSALPPVLANSRLEKFIAAGGIALGCNLAFELDIVPIVMKADGLGHEDARKLALTMLVPGVVLQPSGVFAVVHAQEAGAQYVGLS